MDHNIIIKSEPAWDEVDQTPESNCGKKDDMGHNALSVDEFLKGLPSYDENNFNRFHTESGSRASVQRLPVYLPTKDYPSEQIIVTEKEFTRNKILYERWYKKNSQKKRYHTNLASSEESTSRKRPRRDASARVRSP